MAKIFFIGLGKMGSHMVDNLLKNKHQLTIFDINNKAYKKFLKKNVKISSSLNNISEEFDIIFTMVPDGATLRNIIFNKLNKAFKGKKKYTVWIDCSSIDY